MIGNPVLNRFSAYVEISGFSQWNLFLSPFTVSMGVKATYVYLTSTHSYRYDPLAVAI